MGDVVMISDGSMEMVMEEEEEEDVEMMRLMMEKKKEESVIKWEDFLPRMYIRVLLVESDDCTRKIISALLRKCGYRVTAVSDGSKAWEILEGRPKEIDLVLTEVELPSVSGLCLLTMMMEHEICKNLPVIMMSSNDSIGVVFKCMLRGAVDFLVKPIRKNELRILWQHVWRRHSQSSCSGHGVQVGMSAPKKIGAISENNAASNHSSDCVASTRSNKGSSDKESDAQSSWTKREVETESASIQTTQELSQPKSRTRSPCVASNTEVQNHKDCVELDKRLSTHDNEEEQHASTRNFDEQHASTRNFDEQHASTRNFDEQKDIVQETQREDDNIPCEMMVNNCERVKRPREAIDLMGSFDDHRRTYKTVVREVFCNDSKMHSESNDVTNLFSSGPLLELSLPQFHQSDCGNQQSDEICTLSHSNISAFSPYNNRMPQPFLPILVSVHTEPKEFADNCHQHLANQDIIMTRQVVGRPGQAAATFPCPQPGALLRPVPVNGTRFDSLYSAGYGSALPHMFYMQPCPSSLWNPSSDHQTESAFFVSKTPCSKPETHNDQNVDNSASQTMHKKLRQSSDYVEKPVHITTDTDQSGTSSLCNGSIGHHYSSGYGSVCNGSNGDITPAAVTRVTAEYINEEGLLVHDGNRGTDPHRSTQRELALTKFRLKRKDRCFEKKVRYQSRKRLAEQRPRVKGQFVRQIATDAALTYTDY